MTEHDFARAAFEPAMRQQLLSALMSDPVLCQKARDRVANLALMHERGQVFDRDAISRMTHDILKRLLAQVDAAKRQSPEITVT